MIELKWEVNKIVAVLMLLNMTREKKITFRTHLL